MSNDPLNARERRDLACLVGLMIPASAEYGVPSANDPLIFEDILRSLGRDSPAVRRALRRVAGIGDLSPDQAETTAEALLSQTDPDIVTLGRVVLGCYYRDDRVMHSVGREPRAPFPQGHVLEQGDWSLLDAVRGRPKLWRDAP
jgi:hypothetical protein